MQPRSDQHTQEVIHAFNYLSNALKLTHLTYTTATRDNALLALDTLRVSDTYEAIQTKVKQRNFTPEEYLFYALVTDDVMTLDANMLDRMLQKCETLPYNLRQSLILTSTTVRYAHNENASLKAGLHQSLINELSRNRRADNLHRDIFVNLAGIELTDFDSTVDRTISSNAYSPDLSFCDLRGATFTNCKFDHLAIRYCDVSDATFNNVSNTTKHGGSEFDLIFSIARRATFDNVVAANTAWQYTDFREAEFNHCNLANTHVSGSNFSHAKLHHTKISGGDRAEQRNTNFSHADLTTAEISSVGYDRNIYQGAKWINPASPAELQSEIDRITKKYLACTYYSSRSDLSAFQQLARKDVERYLSTLEATDDEKNALLTQTLQHDLFQYKVMEATNTLVAGGFPRQERPLVLFPQYNDKAHAYRLKGASLAAYQTIYASGMKLLGKLANAMKDASDLQLYTSELEVNFINNFEATKQHMKELGAPDHVLDKSATDLLDFLMQNVPESLAGVDRDTQKVLLLSHLALDHETIQTFQAAKSGADEIDTREIYENISTFHPLLSLRFDAATNCLAPYSSSRNNGAYHSADDLIKDFTDPARLKPPVVESKLSTVSQTLFAGAANDNNAKQKEELQETSSLRASN